MKLLVDQNLPLPLVRRLREAGCEAAHVADFKLAQADDRDIAERARSEQVVGRRRSPLRGDGAFRSRSMHPEADPPSPRPPAGPPD